MVGSTLDLPKLKDLLAPLYHANDVATRWDYAERLAARALAWVDVESAETRDADPDQLCALAYVFPVRAQVLPTLRTRTAVEAYFVSHGWTAVRTREMLRGLERLPDKPHSLEEKLVADAEAVLRFGILGYTRHAILAALAGQSLQQTLEPMHKLLSRRIHTRAASHEASLLREELRALVRSLEDALADER